MKVYVCEECKKFYIDNPDNYMYLVPREYISVEIVGDDCQVDMDSMCEWNEGAVDFGFKLSEVDRVIKDFDSKMLVELIAEVLELNLEAEAVEYGLYYNYVYGKWIENCIEPELYGLSEVFTDRELAYYLLAKYNLDVKKLSVLSAEFKTKENILLYQNNKRISDVTYFLEKKKSAKEKQLSTILGVEEFIDCENSIENSEKNYICLPSKLYNTNYMQSFLSRVTVHECIKLDDSYMLLVNRVTKPTESAISPSITEAAASPKVVNTDSNIFGIFGRKIDDSIDFYQTPDKAVKALLEVENFNGIVYEPCAGAGAISKYLENNGKYVVSSDLREDDNVYGIKKADIFKINDYSVDHIITNPPYKFAKECIYQSLKLSKGKVAMLLNIDFLTSIDRYELFHNTPLKAVYVFSNRITMYPEFYSGKVQEGGMKTFAWFVWDKNYKGNPYVDLIRISDKEKAPKDTPIEYNEVPPIVFEKLFNAGIYDIGQVLFPKFNCALNSLKDAIENGHFDKFAILAKLPFMDSVTRYNYLKENPHWVNTIVFSSRLSSGDPVKYALFVFDRKAKAMVPELRWVI